MESGTIMIHGESVRTLIVSDFNTQSLAGCLNNDSTLPVVDATVSPFGQVMQSLTDLSLPCWQTAPQVAIVWTQPHRVLRSFKLLLEYSPNPIDDLLEEVDSYCDLLVQIADKLQALLVPTSPFCVKLPALMTLSPMTPTRYLVLLSTSAITTTAKAA